MITAVYFWRIKTIFLPLAIIYMAINKMQLKRFPGISFIKMLGTGKGESFTPRDADPTRWGILVTIDENQISNLDKTFVIKCKKSVKKSIGYF